MTTVEIPLTQGKTAVIDEADLSIVSEFKWHYARRRNLEYAATTIKGKTVLMHRMLTNAGEDQDVDHKDSNGLNNTRTNMRVCTHQQNQMGTRKAKGCSSRFKGVCISKERRKKPWSAGIKLNGRSIRLGRFVTEVEAARAYDRAAKKMFGEFARLNFQEAAFFVSKS